MTHLASSISKPKLDLLPDKNWIALAESAGESANGGVRMPDVVASAGAPSVSVCDMEEEPIKRTDRDRRHWKRDSDMKPAKTQVAACARLEPRSASPNTAVVQACLFRQSLEKQDVLG